MQTLFDFMKSKSPLFSTCFFLFILFSLPSHAADIRLQWDSPSDNKVVGYHIYCGKSSSNYQTNLCASVDSAATTTAIITGLEGGFEYSFAATSFDAQGNESNFSNIVSGYIPSSNEIDDDGDGYSESEGDCLDSDPSIGPGAVEVCGDGIDQDCDGSDLLCDASGTQTLFLSDMIGSNHTGLVQDTFININRDVNVSSQQLNTYTWPENTPANAILMKFDLSPLPQGAQIQSAALTLYQTGGKGDSYYDVSVHKIINHSPDLHQADGYTYDGINSWTANSLSYNGIPLAQADLDPAAHVNRLDLNVGFKQWDVTGMVRDWADNPSTNFGLLLNSDATAGVDSCRFFAATESSNATQRPGLVIKYTIDANDMDDDGDGFTENQGDCNDNDAAVSPGAAEICGDGIDQDCDGADLICPEDIDDDGDGMTENQGDCNDGDAAVFPGAAEICSDGIDQDCNGADLICPQDIDDDGDGYTENQGDCNDSDAAVSPGVDEICGDGIDQNCDGVDQTCASSGQGSIETMVFGDAVSTDAPATIQDTFININHDVNATGQMLNTYTWPADTPANAVLIKFDLAKLPKGARIESAALSLYQTGARGEAVYEVSVHKIINHNPDLQAANGFTYNGVDAWTASGDSYDNIPLAQGDIAPAETVNALDRSMGYKEWLVTKMVQDWVKDPAMNFGLLLNSDATAAKDSYRTFASSEADDAALRPALEIEYTIDPADVDDDGDGVTENQGDCNDADATVFPGADEICGDGIDQDCDGADLSCNLGPQTVIFGDGITADYPATIQDTFININRDVNVAGTRLNTYTWPANTPANAVLIKFDLTQLPQNAQIQSATLTLHQTAARGEVVYEVSVHKIIHHNPDLQLTNGFTYNGVDAWTANNASYNSIPLAQADIAAPEDVNHLSRIKGPKHWNVTQMVQEWTSDPAANFGMLLNSDATARKDSYRTFAASEAGDPALRPALEVTYTIE